MTTLRANRLNDLHARLETLEVKLRQLGFDEDGILITETLAELGHLQRALDEVKASLRDLKISLDPPPMVNGRMNSRWR